MKIKNLDKSTFFLALFSVLYIGLIFLNGTVFKIENVILEVIQQITTIPVILIQFALFLFVLSRSIKRNFQFLSYSFFSIIILSVSLISIVMSFINL